MPKIQIFFNMHTIVLVFFLVILTFDMQFSRNKILLFQIFIHCHLSFLNWLN